MATFAVKFERSTPLVLPRHPDAPDDLGFEEWCRHEKSSGRPLAIDLFSGAGGLGAGVEAAGWTVVAAVDNDAAALETHASNFQGRALNVDMSDPAQVSALIERLRPLGIDLVAGGPPCQPFSRAGRAKIRSLIKDGARDEIDARKELWRSFIDVVLALNPRAVLLENVPDMAIGDDLVIIRRIAEVLEDAGYAVDYRLLDAWRHGVPQHRKRFILQARNDGTLPVWPVPSNARPSVREAIEDLPRLLDTTGARELPYTGQPSSELAKALRGNENLETIYDHMTRPVRADDREAFKLMNPSTLYSDLPEHLRRYRSDTFNDKYKRLDWDDLSRTITAHIAKDGYWYIHPSEHRTLTVREAARIQTFPDSFRFAGSRSDAFRQIGNAVPPLLGRVIAEAILPVPETFQERPRLPLLRRMLTEWGEEHRQTNWWLFPGPEMTDAAAALAALLDVHRLTAFKASLLMDPLRGAADLTLDSLQYIDVRTLGETRQRAVRQLRDIIREDSLKDVTSRVFTLMSEPQRQGFSLLRNGNELLVNEHVGKVVTLLMDLPGTHAGLRTDIKIALAQLVSSGDNAALRMCAIRALAVSEARALIKAGLVPGLPESPLKRPS